MLLPVAGHEPRRAHARLHWPEPLLQAGVGCVRDFKARDVSSPLAPLHVAGDANVYDSVSLYEDPFPPPRPSTDALEQGTSADAVELI